MHALQYLILCIALSVCYFEVHTCNIWNMYVPTECIATYIFICSYMYTKQNIFLYKISYSKMSWQNILYIMLPYGV